MKKNTYNMELMRSLNKEYESKKIMSTFVEYSDEYQMKQANKRIDGLLKLGIEFNNKKALEIGCGGGYVSYQLAQRFNCRVMGIDIYQSDVWERLFHSNLQYCVADLSKSNPFQNEEFDIIISYVAWEHIQQPFEVLQQAYNLLKQDGLFFIKANQYCSAIASHLYRHIYFPFPHLLFDEDTVISFALEQGAEQWFIDAFFHLNKLTFAQYKEFFEILGLTILDEKKSIRKLDREFYERFEDKLGFYPIHDLQLDFFSVLMQKIGTQKDADNPTPAKEKSNSAILKNIDRIAEAYKGELGPNMMESSRKRINWIISQVKGETVLDVGCSQGTVSIILAREGKQVTGIDICQESIDYALSSLESEDVTTRKYAEFIYSDFISLVKNTDKIYDCIIMGEILEHLADPERFVKYARQHLADEGTLVITVPFGINDYHDHKRTYYLTEIYSTAAAHFYVKDVVFLGAWLGMVCLKTEGTNIPLTNELFVRTEEAFLTHERTLLNRIASLKKKITAGEKQLETIKNIAQENKTKTQALEKKLKSTEDDSAHWQAQAEKLQQQHAEAIQEHEKLKENAEAVAQALIGAEAEAEKNIAYWQDQAEKLQQQHAEAVQEHEKLIENAEAEAEKNIAYWQDQAEKLHQQHAEVVQEHERLIEDAEAEAEKNIAYWQDQAEKLHQQHTETVQEHKKLKQKLNIQMNVTKKDKVKLSTAETKLSQQLNRYNNLSNSKLGRLQLKIWERRTRRKYKRKYRERFGERIKRFLRKSPALVRAVRKFRAGQERKNNAKKVEQPNKKIAPKKTGQSNKKTAPKKVLQFDMDFIGNVEHMLNAMPVSNGSRFYRKSGQKTAIIADEFLYNAYKDITDLVYITPENWKEQIRCCDFLLVVSAWMGLNDEWIGLPREGTKIRGTAYEIIDYCKSIKIPTVYYGKEDPANYSLYIGIAKHCDYVFTTAVEIIPDYIRDCGHNLVYPLMFGINPIYHNPVGSRSFERQQGVVFSGSWTEKYPKRGVDMRVLFEGILSARRWLKIIDRNFHKGNERFAFPKEYAPYISPEISHDQLQKLHKLYDWAININTVKDSQTMFANRVFELGAAGCLLISNYSAGVNSNAPVVFTVEDVKEIGRVLDSLSPKEIRERQAASIRHAMNGNTCFDRFSEICEHVGISYTSPSGKIAVVVEAITEEIQRQFMHQTYQDKELLTVDELQVLYDEFDMVAFFDSKRDYDIFYLEDMVAGFKYTDSDYITKDCYYHGDMFRKGIEHGYVNEIHSKFGTVFWRASFDAETLINMGEEKTALPNGYSVDCLHYNADATGISIPPVVERKYKLSVVLPIYNNGLHLYTKAFDSLRRSVLFDDMEIIMVDDGSTDGITENYIRYIAKRYSNIRTYFFGDGGSGSASRPRNKGTEMATSEHLTFLDPDDEVWNDGYAALYAIATENNYDLVVGNSIVFRKKQTLARHYHYFEKVYGSTLIEGDKNTKKDLLAKISFTPMKFQSMVFRRSIIIENGLQQVVGALGQDTLFAWQLILHAKRIRAVDISVCAYYAVREGSVVNTVGQNFFRKYLILEQSRIKWLKQEDLLDVYMEKRFNFYFKNWTLRKLKAGCRPEEYDEAVKTIIDIFELYRDYYDGKDEEINEFIKRHGG